MAFFVIALGQPAAAEVVDFNDISLANANPSYVPGTNIVTGYYFNGPTANSVPSTDPYGDPTLDGTFAVGSPASIELSNSYVPSSDPSSASWSGFAISNVNDPNDAGYLNQYAAVTGVGAGPGVGGNPDNYAVDFGYLDQKANGAQSFNFDPSNPTQLAMLPHVQLPAGYQIQSMDVTNTTYAVMSMLNGDQFAKQFGPGDFFELSVYGTNAAGQVLPNSVNFYLADFLNGASSIVENWTTLDLSSLSAASTLYFNLSSSDVGAFGMNTPGYFALDNVHIAATQTLAGDANGDGIVNSQDLALVSSSWLQTGSDLAADVNHDGIVNSQDLALISSNWLASSNMTFTAPEPAACGLAAIGCFVFVVYCQLRRD
ncbi:MAG TPA: DUF4465 domain-containing protein [Pirellulales bacterium]|nr:DUF4465 domain-containing protein [Pirellulales bacterium]